MDIFKRHDQDSKLRERAVSFGIAAGGVVAVVLAALLSPLVLALVLADRVRRL